MPDPRLYPFFNLGRGLLTEEGQEAVGQQGLLPFVGRETIEGALESSPLRAIDKVTGALARGISPGIAGAANFLLGPGTLEQTPRLDPELSARIEARQKALQHLPADQRQRELLGEERVALASKAIAGNQGYDVVDDTGLLPEFGPRPPGGQQGELPLGFPSETPQFNVESAYAPINTSTILAQFDKTKPGQVEQTSKQDLMLRVLFGLAAGAAQGSRGFLGTPQQSTGLILASAGAGGLGALHQTKAEDKAARLHNEERFQEYNRQRSELQIQLEEAEARRTLAIEKARFENRMLQHQQDIANFKASRDQVQITPEGVFTIHPDGTYDFATVEGQSFLRNQLQLQLAMMKSTEDIMVGFDNQLKLMGIHKDQRPYHIAAAWVLHAGADPEMLEGFTQDALSKDERLTMLRVQSMKSKTANDAYREELARAVYTELLKFFYSNPAEAMRVLKGTAPGG